MLSAVEDVPPTEVPPPGADAPRAGGLREVLAPRWRAIAISIAATLAVALALLITLPKPNPATVRVVDPSQAVKQAMAVPDFAVYLPSPLLPGWQPNSARFDTAVNRVTKGPHLHIGYVTPDHAYAGLEEGDSTPRWRFVSAMTAGDVFKELVTIDGNVWAHVQSSRKMQDSLVWYGRSTVVVVTGTTSLANLESFAASLHVGTDPAQTS